MCRDCYRHAEYDSAIPQIENLRCPCGGAIWLRAAGAVLSWSLCLLMALGLSGCVSASKAKEQERAAFVAGQRQAQQQFTQSQQRGPSVTIVGPVRNPVVRWTVGLTLAKALVAANYFGASDPTQIVILRDGRPLVVNLQSFLAGEDVSLKPRDVIELNNGQP